MTVAYRTFECRQIDCVSIWVKLKATNRVGCALPIFLRCAMGS